MMNQTGSATINDAISNQRKRWRRIAMVCASALTGIYLITYFDFRFRHEIIHKRSYSELGTVHIVEPATPDGPFIFAAAAIAGQVDRLDEVSAGVEQRRRTLSVLFGPLCSTEEVVWEIFD